MRGMPCKISASSSGVFSGAPRGGDGEERVAQRPGHHHRVVGHNDEADEDLEPAEPLEAAAEPPEDGGGGAAEAVAQGVVEQEDGDSGRQQGDDVGDNEGAPAVGVGHAGEAPDIAQADGRADGGHEEAELAAQQVRRVSKNIVNGRMFLPPTIATKSTAFTMLPKQLWTGKFRNQFLMPESHRNLHIVKMNFANKDSDNFLKDFALLESADLEEFCHTHID